MDASFAGLVSLCTSGEARTGLAAGLLGGLFLAGAAGSLVHCAPMCGGFVMGQASDNMARLPATRMCEWHRLQAGLLVPYHLGRLTTYTTLGVLAASGTAILGRLPYFTWLSVALMAAAGVAFLLQALAWVGLVHMRAPGVPTAWSRLLARLTRRIDRSGVLGGYLLGLVLGLLPCSFLYGALFAAAAGGGWLHGGLAMACFGLGTMPVLMMIGVTGHAAARRLPRAAGVVTPILMIWNSAILLGSAVIESLS